MKKLKYYVAVTEASAGASILGSGWSPDEAISDAKANGAASVASILRVPAELADRIEEEGDSNELASECYAKGESL